MVDLVIKIRSELGLGRIQKKNDARETALLNPQAYEGFRPPR